MKIADTQFFFLTLKNSYNMDLIKLTIVGISYSESQKDAYVLILGEQDGDRRIPIIIGNFEAQAIAIVLENIQIPRPLTHDLIKSIADELDFVVNDVFINRFENGVFYTKITILQNDKKIEIDSRTSDAVALAIRFKCPIYTTEEIISRTGITLNEISNNANNKEDEADDDEISEKSMLEEEVQEEEKRMEFIFDTIEELEEKLKIAIKNEDFELASIIRDEMKSRE